MLLETVVFVALLSLGIFIGILFGYYQPSIAQHLRKSGYSEWGISVFFIASAFFWFPLFGLLGRHPLVRPGTGLAVAAGLLAAVFFAVSYYLGVLWRRKQNSTQWS